MKSAHSSLQLLCSYTHPVLYEPGTQTSRFRDPDKCLHAWRWKQKNHRICGPVVKTKSMFVYTNTRTGCNKIAHKRSNAVNNAAASQRMWNHCSGLQFFSIWILLKVLNVDRAKKWAAPFRKKQHSFEQTSMMHSGG